MKNLKRIMLVLSICLLIIPPVVAIVTHKSLQLSIVVLATLYIISILMVTYVALTIDD